MTEAAPAAKAPRLFGTDGVRGLANADLTPQLALDLARASVDSPGGQAFIGRDTRRSGPMLVAALKAGFHSAGVDTVDLGIIPVGAVSRLTKQARARCGVMVSASHNPAPDNGIKFFGRDGMKLADEREREIEQRIADAGPFSVATGADIGFDITNDAATEQYLDYLESLCGYTLRGIEIAIDCAHGAAFKAAPMLFDRLKADVAVHNIEPDGNNINLDAGATSIDYLVGAAGGRVGLAFDGDADRLIAVDENGVPANGDVLLAIMAQYMRDQGRLRNDAVAVTVMSNLGFHKAMERIGVEVVQTDVGDRHVLAAMVERGLSLGGEQSGHIILEEQTTGDGLRSALRLLEVMAATGKPLSELRTVMTEYPQVLRNVRVADKGRLTDAPGLHDAITQAERDLDGDGRILVRASGTEPVVRVMVEASDEATANGVAAQLSTVVADELGTA